MKEIWDWRYSSEEYVYGVLPNEFFAEQLSTLSPSTIILPCEGEGRNAVFAAALGWNVMAFDQSETGKEKSLALAKKNNVSINYIVTDASTFNVEENSFDVVAFIYAHFPIETRRIIHQNAIRWLKPGGHIILEAFNPQQINNTSGGPKDKSLLYTEEYLLNDFAQLKIELLQSVKIKLSEGDLHNGSADVIRFMGKKL